MLNVQYKRPVSELVADFKAKFLDSEAEKKFGTEFFDLVSLAYGLGKLEVLVKANPHGKEIIKWASKNFGDSWNSVN